MNIEIEANKKRSYPKTEQIKVELTKEVYDNLPKEIQIITKEMLDNLRPDERNEAKENYFKWRSKVRKQDRNEIQRQVNKINNFKRNFNRTLISKAVAVIDIKSYLHYSIYLLKNGKYKEHMYIYNQN